MLDESTNNRIQNGDLGDYQYASPLKITPGQGSTEPAGLVETGPGDRFVTKSFELRLIDSTKFGPLIPFRL